MGKIQSSIMINDRAAHPVDNIAVKDGRKLLQPFYNLSFHKRFTHQKRQRVPINLQSNVNIEIGELIHNGRFEKLDNCSDQNFISPNVTTVKRDQSIKLALDTKIINKSIHKYKSQMPNIDSLIDSITKKLRRT